MTKASISNRFGMVRSMVCSIVAWGQPSAPLPLQPDLHNLKIIMNSHGPWQTLPLNCSSCNTWLSNMPTCSPKPAKMKWKGMGSFLPPLSLSFSKTIYLLLETASKIYTDSSSRLPRISNPQSNGASLTSGQHILGWLGYAQNPNACFLIKQNHS